MYKRQVVVVVVVIVVVVVLIVVVFVVVVVGIDIIKMFDGKQGNCAELIVHSVDIQ